MPRHHNRAILSEITDKKLDPSKKYINGKHSLVLSSKEAKSPSIQTMLQDDVNTTEVVLEENEENENVKENENVEDVLDSLTLDLQEKQTTKKNSFKKKNNKQNTKN